MGYLAINGHDFGIEEFILLVTTIEADGAAVWSTYSAVLLPILGFHFILLNVLVYFFRRYVKQNNRFISLKIIFLLFIFSFVSTFSVTYKTHGGILNFPQFVRVINLIIFHQLNGIYYGPRASLDNKPTANSIYKNIILIVDESVGGQYLSINGYIKDTTPYLRSIKGNFVNLGLASSSVNCSTASNLLLRTGLWLHELPDYEHNSLKNPSIFHYAKNANYQTHYIYGQDSEHDKYTNYLTSYDLVAIDNMHYTKHNDVANELYPEHEVIRAIDQALEGDVDKIYICC